MSKSKLNVKKLSPNEFEELAERPYAVQMLQLQILYDMAGMLEDIAETLAHHQSEFKSTIPQGKLEPIGLLITDTRTVLKKENCPTMPWITFNLFNDGPNPVYVDVNKDQPSLTAPLAIGDAIQVDMKVPKIKRVLLICSSGNTAAVRIYAKR